jgi:hypothetical protein
LIRKVDKCKPLPSAEVTAAEVKVAADAAVTRRAPGAYTPPLLTST